MKKSAEAQLRSLIEKHLLRVMGAAIAVIYLLVGIFKSTNSTAAIGFIMIPFFAALGAFAGDAIQYGWDLIQKKRSHSMPKTVLILVVVVFVGIKWIQSYAHDQDLQLAKNPATPLPQILQLLQKNDPALTAAIAANPSLPPNELDNLIHKNLTDYHLIYSAVQHPSLNMDQIKRIANLTASDFKGRTEYELYQNFVWAALAQRPDIPAETIHVLAAKSNPQHFLILALLESATLTCAEKQKFLPQSNQVLENSILKSIEQSHCPADGASSK